MMQHFIQGYLGGVRVTENYHAYRVAHEDDVDAALVEQTGRRIIVCRERGYLLPALLHLAKVFHAHTRRKIARRLRNASCLIQVLRSAPHRTPIRLKVERDPRARWLEARSTFAWIPFESTLGRLGLLPLVGKSNHLARLLGLSEELTHGFLLMGQNQGRSNITQRSKHKGSSMQARIGRKSTRL